MADAEQGTLREKRCAACGEAFDCLGGGCWCDAVPLTDAVRASLRRQFADCLCPACLRERATTAECSPSGDRPLR